MTFPILYVHVIWNQTQHSTNCYATTYSKIELRNLFNGIKEIDKHMITNHKNDLNQFLLYGDERYSYDTNRMIL